MFAGYLLGLLVMVRLGAVGELVFRLPGQDDIKETKLF